MFQQSLKFTQKKVLINVVALCLERYDLLSAVANVPEFSSRGSWFEPWSFKPEDSTSQFTYSSSQFWRVFRSVGWLGFLWWAPFSTSSFPSSLGIQHWLGFVSGVRNNPSGSGPSVNLHKVDLVTHVTWGIYTTEVQFVKESFMIYEVMCCSYNTNIIRKSSLQTFYLFLATII